MTSRIQHLLLVALFATAHLVVQPFAAAGWCMGGMEMGGQCCCSPQSVDGAASLGCCGSGSPTDGEPEDSEGYGSTKCDCSASPPAPAVPEQSLPSVAGGDEGSKTTEAAWGGLQSGVWPSVAVRAARPPNQPPWVVGRTRPAFTQVYRL